MYYPVHINIDIFFLLRSDVFSKCSLFLRNVITNVSLSSYFSVFGNGCVSAMRPNSEMDPKAEPTSSQVNVPQSLFSLYRTEEIVKEPQVKH